MDQKTADGARVKYNFRLGGEDNLLGYCKRLGISAPNEFADEKESGSCRSGRLQVRGTRLRRLQVCEGQWESEWRCIRRRPLAGTGTTSPPGRMPSGPRQSGRMGSVEQEGACGFAAGIRAGFE